MSLSLDTLKPLPTNPRKALINARAVAWALSSAALCCLVAGVLALRSLGGLGGTPNLEDEPEQVSAQPNQIKPKHPIVLTPNSQLPETAGAEFDGYESLFSPSTLGEQPSGGSAPRPATATLPGPTNR